MAELACRTCRVSLSADVPGCAICAGYRDNLISTTEVAEDNERPALSQVAQETVAFLRNRASYYRKELKDKPGSEMLAKGALANANAITKLLEAARRLQGDGLAAVANMSFVERAKLFVIWYAELAPAYRHRLREQLDQHEADAAKPVGPRHIMLPPGPEPGL